MKALTLFLTLCLFLAGCGSSQNPNNIPQLNCAEFWGNVPFSTFCSMQASDFDYNDLPFDNCKGDSNDSYDNDELIYITAYNHSMMEYAVEDYNVEKGAWESNPNFAELSGVGDEGFIAIDIEFGRLDGMYAYVRKGLFSVSVEINGNSANNSNNCFTPSNVEDFVKALVDAL